MRACCCSRTDYFMREAPGEEFEEILMSTTMGADHMPDLYYMEVRRMLQARLKHLTV